MKKVLILTNYDEGLYNCRKELIAELLKRRYKVIISLPEGNKVVELEKLGCSFIQTNVDRRGTNPINDVKLFIKYICILKTVKPDIVLTYTVKPNLYGGIACGLRGIPYVCNVTGLGSGFLNKGLAQIIIKSLSKISFIKAQCVMVQNSEDLETLQKLKVFKNNSQLIPGSGVNLEEYKVLTYPKEENGIQFSFIARIMKDKGIDEYLEAAKLIKIKYPQVIFNVIGNIEQEHYTEILNKYVNEGIIIYHGFQNNIKMLIERTHCTINPSYTEGMSNVLLESAACGRAIIASDIPGCREIIDNGNNGYTFKVKNTIDLSQKIEKFLELSHEEKRRMGIEGRKKVVREFDRSIIIDTYLKEIEKS